MSTFVLKKYEEPPTQKPDEVIDQDDSETTSKSKENEVVVKIEGSVAEVVINALQSILVKKEEHPEQAQVIKKVKTVTTEEINLDPLKAFGQISSDDIVYIRNNGFTTNQEEWFLTNLPNKTENVFFSINSLSKHLAG